MFCRFAADLADLSTCKRKVVGCVIVPATLTEVLAVGYNSPPSRVPNDACRNVPGDCGCVHAEANAVAKLRGGGDNLVLISTTAPCERCAGLIINCQRVSDVVWLCPYRDDLGLNVLEAAGVRAWHAPALAPSIAAALGGVRRHG